MSTPSYESFPLRIVILSNLLAVAIYALGAYLLAGLHIALAVVYVLYCLWIEFRVLTGSCVHCCYYGKVCGFGKGKLCYWLFRKGDPRKFVEREISWRHVVPDFLVFILPLAGGVVLLVTGFSWLTLALILALVVLSFGGTAFVRGSFACKYCRQREIGCPAEKLFGKRKQEQAP